MFEQLKTLRKIKSPEERFVLACEYIDKATEVDLPALGEARYAYPEDLDLRQAQIDNQYLIACLAIERIRVIRELVDEHSYNFVEIAALTNPDAVTKDGRKVASTTSTAGDRPAMTRQRIHQLYQGSKKVRAKKSS